MLFPEARTVLYAKKLSQTRPYRGETTETPPPKVNPPTTTVATHRPEVERLEASRVG